MDTPVQCAGGSPPREVIGPACLSKQAPRGNPYLAAARSGRECAAVDLALTCSGARRRNTVSIADPESARPTAARWSRVLRLAGRALLLLALGGVFALTPG